MKKTETELRECLKNAWPVECMEAHGAADRTIEEIGNVQGAYGRWYKLYSDSAGGYWYQTLYGTASGVATEYEAIYGHRKRA